jgi:acylphosphatase
MERRRVHVWIKGRVQGVFFRAFTRDAALMRGVSGWVRNLPDGRVEAVFEGDADRVADMVQWCYEGSPLSRVENVDTQEEAYRGDLEGFDVSYRR